MELKEKLKRREFIFLVAWAIFTCTAMLVVTFFKYSDEYAAIEPALKLLRMGSYCICIVLILWQEYKRSKILALVLMMGIVLLSTLMSHNTVMLWCFLFIAAGIGVDAEKITFVSVVARAIIIGGTVLFSQIGLTEDYIFSADTRARHGLGFDWATTGPILFFFLSLAYIYLRRERLKFLELIIIEVCHIFFYNMTDTRMTFYLGTATVLFFIINLFVKKKWYWTKRLGYLWCAVPAVIAIVAVLLHVLYKWDNPIFMALNALLSGRLQLGFDAYHNYGLSLFGQPIEWVGFGINESGVGYNYVDCSYMQHLLEYGIVFLGLLLTIYTIIIYRGIKHHDYYLVWICLITLVFCVTEPWLFNFTFNPIPVMVLADIKDRTDEGDRDSNEQKYKNYRSNS